MLLNFLNKFKMTSKIIKGKPVVYENDELIFIGAAVRYHREKRGIGQLEMANILNITPVTYSKKERYNKFTPDQLDTIAKRFNLNINFTITESPHITYHEKLARNMGKK